MLYKFDYTSIISLSFDIDAKPKNHGSESNKNILFWVKIYIHSVGLRMDFPDLKDHTIAVPVMTKFMVVTLSKLTTEPASMPVSKSQEQMPKSCLLNGNFKLDPARGSKWAISFGWQGELYLQTIFELGILIEFEKKSEF